PGDDGEPDAHALASLLALRGGKVAEEASDFSFFAFLERGDQRLDLGLVEPETVPAGASVEFHSVHVDDLEFLPAAQAAAFSVPLAPRRVERPADPAAAAFSGREHLELARVQPRPAALEAAVDL